MINNFRIKMLIDINVFVIKDINLIIVIRKSYIDNYYITFKFTIIFSSKLFIKLNVILKKLILISTHFYITIFIKRVKLFSKNYIFKFANECFIALFVIIINSLFYKILTHNDFK